MTVLGNPAILKLDFKYVKISDITINSKYRKAVVEPNDSDYKSLYHSIEIGGINTPLIVNQKFVLLDGHTRYYIAKKLGLDSVPITIKHFDDPLLEAMFVIDINVSRRNLTEGQKAKLIMSYLEIEEKLAARRKTAGKKNIDVENIGRAAAKVSEKFNMSPRQIDRVRKIMREGSTDVKNKYESGKITTNAAYQAVQRETRVVTNKSLPSGKHNVGYMDLPWEYDNQKTGGSMTSAANQKYDTLTPEEIIDEFIGRTFYECDFCKNKITNDVVKHMRKKVVIKDKKPIVDIICSMCGHKMKYIETKPKKDIMSTFAKDAVLFMWMTVPMLDEQWSVVNAMKEHGFKFKQMIFWVKTGRKGIGYWFENQVEILAMLVRGNVEAFRSSLPNCMILPVGKHSEKPEEFRNLIDRATASMGKRTKIEYFPREQHHGWVSWGNEV